MAPTTGCRFFACKGLVDVTDVKDSGPRDMVEALPADTYAETGMVASTKSGCTSLHAMGSLMLQIRRVQIQRERIKC